MRTPLVAGNWKLYGTKDSIKSLLTTLHHSVTHHPTLTTEMVVLPSALFIPQVETMLQKTPIAWGAQDMSPYRAGAYTGDISGDLLKEFGCRYTLLGHSERANYHHEYPQDVLPKLKAAHEVGLKPILCLGETRAAYQANQTKSSLLNQLKTYFTVGPDVLQNVILAYEPQWAIGTGEAAHPEKVQSIHQWIRQILASELGSDLANCMRILYGGSIQPNNAKSLFEMPDIDGGLVGRASLSADKFLSIYYACQPPC